MSSAVRDLTAALEDRYVIEREVGRGAMATVFLAREVRHNRDVALKVLDPELTHSVAAERFLREIRTAATLTHPHILPVHDSGRAAGLLYYVTPYVTGQTLRECLKKEGRLPVADALSITQQIADALAYAHEQGVVHRDIKPENILLTSGNQVWVADFGLAHALTAGADARLTRTGMSVGSPLYMSPEQASGSSRIDGRADIYALGCLSYEMLAGAPPFTGEDIPSVLAKHLAMPAPHVTQSNKLVPPHVEAAICKALEKSPAKRYATAREFRDALLPRARVWPAMSRRSGIVAGLLLAAVLGWLFVQNRDGNVSFSALAWPTRVELDTARYVVLPFAAGAPALDIEAQQRMHDALRRWRGIDVVDLIRVQEQVRPDSANLTTAVARRVARQMNAGRFVRGSVSRLDGRVRVTAAVYDAHQRNRMVDQVTVVQANAAFPLDSLFALIADSLLFDTGDSSDRAPAPRGTKSRPAREAYLAGYRALMNWDVARADSLFERAIAADPTYSQPRLWLAEVRSWLSDSPSEWQLQAERAVAGNASLTEREQRLSEALYALATSQFPRACAIYDSLANADPQDFIAAYGTGDCRRRDRLVVADAASESGWRFRSSFYRGILGYRRAFQLLPSTHKGFRANSFARVQDLLFTRTSQLTSGQTADKQRFLAIAALRGDTIAFVPYPRTQLQASEHRSSPEAVRWLRGVYYEIARTWSRAYPRSAGALEALALATDLNNDPAALKLLREARGYASDERERAHLGALQVVVGLKRALPRDREGIRAARELADSLVRAHPSSDSWSTFAPAIALVSGHPDYAAQVARAGVAQEPIDGLPLDVWSDAKALLTYASIAVRPDSLRDIEARMRARIAHSTGTDADFAYQLSLIRPAFMAFPIIRLSTLTSKYAAGDHLVFAQNAYANGNIALARDSVLGKRASRINKNPADLQFDAIYPEAWLLHATGASKAAAEWLDPTLNSLAQQDPAALADFARTAGMLRALELRARIADALGDRANARLWADALLLLWEDADPVLQPVVAELRRLR